MKKDFSILKEELLRKAKDKKACRDEYMRAHRANNEEELLKVIADNLNWCSKKEVIDHEWFKGFTPEIYFSSGIANSGKENTGYSNTGDSNTGDRNTGDRNTGSWNTGSWNTGDRNTGYSNTGSWNTGVFCTGKLYLEFFNRPSEWTENDFRNSEAYSLLCNYVDTKMWIASSNMTEEEKTKYPSHTTTGGYYRDIPFKEAFTNAWHNWNDHRRGVFKSLPNFDAAIFEQITGVKI